MAKRKNNINRKNKKTSDSVSLSRMGLDSKYTGSDAHRVSRTVTEADKSSSTHNATAILNNHDAKLLINLQLLEKNYKKRVNNTRGFITDISQALDLKQREASHYGSFSLPNGEEITLRISNHNASVSNFDEKGEKEGISIVVSNHRNKKIKINGDAHIIEYFYPKRKIEHSKGKPLAGIISSVRNLLITGVYQDETRLAIPQETKDGIDITNSDLDVYKKFPDIQDTRDEKYQSEVDDGNIEEAITILKEAALENGYTTTDYQGKDSWSAPTAEPDSKDFDNLEVLQETIDEYGGESNIYGILQGIRNQPDDYYFHPERLNWHDKAGVETGEVYRRLRDSHATADTIIPVYRVVPNSVKGNYLMQGDWVALSRAYCEDMGNSKFGKGEYRIIEQQVPIKNLWQSGDDPRELGFDDGREDLQKNIPNNRLVLDIEYDEDGNLIPLSQRIDGLSTHKEQQISDNPQNNVDMKKKLSDIIAADAQLTPEQRAERAEQFKAEQQEKKEKLSADLYQEERHKSTYAYSGDYAKVLNENDNWRDAVSALRKYGTDEHDEYANTLTKRVQAEDLLDDTQRIVFYHGKQLRDAAYYNQFKFPEGVDIPTTKLHRDKEGTWFVSAEVSVNDPDVGVIETSKHALSEKDVRALFLDHTSTKEQLAAHYLNDEIKAINAEYNEGIHHKLPAGQNQVTEPSLAGRNLDTYLEGKTELQKGKIQNTLNALVRPDFPKDNFGIVSRGDFVKAAAEKGLVLSYMAEKGKINYGIRHVDDSHYEQVTKTEADFAKYLGMKEDPKHTLELAKIDARLQELLKKYGSSDFYTTGQVEKVLDYYQKHIDKGHTLTADQMMKYNDYKEYLGLRTQRKMALFHLEQNQLKAPAPAQSDEYVYTMTHRPFGLGTFHEDGFLRYEDNDVGLGQLVYDHKLDKDIYEQYELRPDTELKSMVGNVYTHPDVDGQLAILAYVHVPEYVDHDYFLLSRDVLDPSWNYPVDYGWKATLNSLEEAGWKLDTEKTKAFKLQNEGEVVNHKAIPSTTTVFGFESDSDDKDNIDLETLRRIDDFVRKNGIPHKVYAPEIHLNNISVDFKEGSSIDLHDSRLKDGSISTVYTLHKEGHNLSVSAKHSDMENGKSLPQSSHQNIVIDLMSATINKPLKESVDIVQMKAMTSVENTSGRWHQPEQNEKRVFAEYGRILSYFAEHRKGNSFINPSSYVKGNDPISTLMLSVWCELNNFRHNAFLTDKEVADLGLVVNPVVKPLPLLKKTDSGTEIVNVYNFWDTNLFEKINKDQFPFISKLYDERVQAADKAFDNLKFNQWKIDRLAKTYNWRVPIAQAVVGSQLREISNSGRSAIYNGREILIEQKGADIRNSDVRITHILDALTESLFDRDRGIIPQGNPDNGEYQKMTRLMNAINYGIDLRATGGFLTDSDTPLVDTRRLYEDADYTREALTKSSMAAQAIKNRSNGIDDGLDLSNDKAQDMDDDDKLDLRTTTPGMGDDNGDGIADDQQNYAASAKEDNKIKNEEEEHVHRGRHF